MHYTQTYLWKQINALATDWQTMNESITKVTEIIATMKSNNESVKQWAEQLEQAVGIETMTLDVEIIGNP
jgi:prefoldin subunit 5